MPFAYYWVRVYPFLGELVADLRGEILQCAPALIASDDATGSRVVTVDLAPAPYAIRVGAGLLGRVGELWPARPGAKAAVITADSLALSYGTPVIQGLLECGWGVALLTVPDGEGSKTLAEAGRLYDGLLNGGLDRGSTVFALGGGVIGDLSGFVAATYMRGLPFVQLPTTLLAQVDASVGGKTAVDLPRGKNLVGAFHQPSLVVADVAALGTLPEREFRSGLAEVVKHAAIADLGLFELLESIEPAQLQGDTDCLTEVVARNCAIKAAVVMADPLERGWRAVLNYGHTLGHAVEVGVGAWDMRHGEAVALGMLAESRLTAELGLCEASVGERLERLLTRLGLLDAGIGWNPEVARAALSHDKKLRDGRLQLPYVPQIGSVGLATGVSLEDLAQALDELAEERA